jgi:hypothetical protein
VTLAGILVVWFIGWAVTTMVKGTVGLVIGAISEVLVFAGIGSILLKYLLGGPDRFVLGFVLAFLGFLLSQFLFGWRTVSPDYFCQLPNNCNLGAIMEALILNMIIIGVGMAIVSVPVVLYMLHKQREPTSPS